MRDVRNLLENAEIFGCLALVFRIEFGNMQKCKSDGTKKWMAEIDLRFSSQLLRKKLRSERDLGSGAFLPAITVS